MLFQCFYLYLCLFHTNNISKIILSSHFKNLLPFLYWYHSTFHDWIYIFLFLWPSVLDILFQDLKLCIIFWVNNIGIAISHLFSDIINFISSISISYHQLLNTLHYRICRVRVRFSFNFQVFISIKYCIPVGHIRKSIFHKQPVISKSR